MTRFKTGVGAWWNSVPKRRWGAGRSLPKDAKLLVRFNTSAVIGDPLTWRGSHHGFVEELRTRIEALKALAMPLRWQ